MLSHDQPPELDYDAPAARTGLVIRAAGAVVLVLVAVIHLLDLPETLEETQVIGYGFLALIAACLALAVLLMTVSDQRVWAAAAAVAIGAIAAYVLSRTTGLPADDDDIGNWSCVLGIAALATETLVILLGSWGLAQRSTELTPVPELIARSED
jgi:hypothetical protein